LFRVAAAHGKNYGDSGSSADRAGLAMHMALVSLKSQYNRLKPDQVAVSFEGSQNWRKAYTRGERSEVPVSQRLYKGNRVKDDSMIPFFELIADFERLVREHTSLVCLSHPQLEGDDVIAAYARKFSAVGDEVTILSDDKDFVQLLKLPNVRLVRPDGTVRGIDKDTKEPIDPEFFMYEKIFRGDVGDNVLPALPRVQSKRLKKAFDALKKGDTFEHSNLMNTTWDYTDTSTGQTRKLGVKDMYFENKMLMDLVDGQPKDIQELMEQTVDHAILHHGTFSFFHFQRFCGKFSLKRISEEASNFVPLFSSTGLNSPLKAETKAIREEKKRKGTLVF
jgi:hypothetical protein